MNAIPLRVLILEDVPADASLMLHELRRSGFAPDWQRVETEAQFLAGLDTAPELILADYTLPQFGAAQALARVRERALDVPFLIVTGTIGEETAVEAMKQGAIDFILKDRLARLGPAVLNALERKRVRAEKRQAEAQLQLQASAMEAAAHGILITDRAGRIQYVNSALVQMAGYTKDEMLGQNPRLLKSGKHDLEFYRGLWETILAGNVWRGEITNRRKDGSLFFDMQSITPVRDERGALTHFIAIHQDVTERKQLEAQYLQAQKMEAFGCLAGGVAHDFNNLLTVICGFSEMILDTLPQQAPMRDMLLQIKKAGERAVGLTQQLLAFSRKQVLQPQVLGLNKELDDLKKMLSRLVGEHIELSFQPQAEECYIKADATQFQQVIINLAVNARDAMVQGGKLTFATRKVDLDEAFIRSHPRAQAGPHVLLEVGDTGCGMTSEVLARIFEPFFTTKGPGKGTGLGLATVLGIVEQSEGFIEVESQPGMGTLFRIYLPRVSISSPGLRKRPSLPGQRRGGETILLVEDDDGVRTLTSLILRSSGYTVLEARDGGMGLEIFAKHNRPIQLLLTDVVMPRMDGCQLAEQLAARGPSLRVLYMSGYLDDAILRHGIQERGLPFLHKPFQAETLLAKVREVLDQPRNAERTLAWETTAV